MISVKIEGIDELDKYIKNVNKEMKNLNQNILEEVASEGYDKLSKGFSEIGNIDGNDIGTTTIDIKDNTATISEEGKDVAYIEFGTGYTGKSASHPMAGKLGWKYAIGKKIRYSKSHGKMGWYYGKDGKWTTGIPAQRITLKTGEDLEKFASKYAIKKVGDILNG